MWETGWQQRMMTSRFSIWYIYATSSQPDGTSNPSWASIVSILQVEPRCFPRQEMEKDNDGGSYSRHHSSERGAGQNKRTRKRIKIRRVGKKRGPSTTSVGNQHRRVASLSQTLSFAVAPPPSKRSRPDVITPTLPMASSSQLKRGRRKAATNQPNTNKTARVKNGQK